MLPPNSIIGIVGGGQLGRMSSLAAAQLGFRVHILSDSADGPASQVSMATTIGPYDDPDTLERFAKQVDVITFEFENISAKGIDLLSQLKPVYPSGNILRISQDRLKEKQFMIDHHIPVAPWVAIHKMEDLKQAAELLNFPFILKTTRLGYDGKGQAIIRSAADLQPAFDALKPHPLIAEKYVDFSCEISVMVVRGQDKTICTFDVTENQHKNGILNLSFTPARIPPDLQEKARSCAIQIAESLELIGILGVEMFVDKQDNILINEIAPRPHNSGHWTINACSVNQFEMHIRAVAGLPLPPAKRHSDAVMKNLIGPEGMAKWKDIVATPGLIGHLYGKDQAKPGRKMGHVNILFPFNTMPGDFGIQAALGPLKD